MSIPIESGHPNYPLHNTTTTTNTTTQAESKEQVQEVPQQADADLPDSFKIESNGANVTVELVDGVYVVKVHDTVTEPQAIEAPTESVNMYEIIKIVLLAVLVLAVFMKRKE